MCVLREREKTRGGLCREELGGDFYFSILSPLFHSPPKLVFLGGVPQLWRATPKNERERAREPFNLPFCAFFFFKTIDAFSPSRHSVFYFFVLVFAQARSHTHTLLSVRSHSST